MSEKNDTFSCVNRFLSHILKSEGQYDGHVYPSVEHAYQAAKTTNLKIRRSIRELDKCSEAKKCGQRVTLRPGWETMKLDVMYQLCKQKFSKTPLREKLLMTGDAELIEGN